MSGSRKLRQRNQHYGEYLQAKSIYRRMVSRAKKAANEKCISEAHNPFKAAWSIQKKSVEFDCEGSPDDINDFFVGSLSNC